MYYKFGSLVSSDTLCDVNKIVCYNPGIRTVLLESEDHECPDCNEKDVSPDTLIPNRFLRNNVNNFKNATGYNKSTMRQPVPVIGVPPLMQQMPSEPSGPMHEFTDAPAGLSLPLHSESLCVFSGVDLPPCAILPYCMNSQVCDMCMHTCIVQSTVIMFTMSHCFSISVCHCITGL